MTRRALIIVAILAVAGCDDTPSGPAAGKANLRVTVTAKPKTGAKPFQTYKPNEAAKSEAAASKGEFELVDYGHISEIAVWVEPVNATPVHAPVQHQIELKSNRTDPPLFAVSVGDVATFVNTGPKPMRYYSVSEGNQFLGTLASGGTKAEPLRGIGLVEILDGDTFDVLARIYVTPGQGARLVHTGKATTFRDLDPGAYRVAAWHERLPGGERDVTLAPNTDRELDLLIGVNALPKVE